MPALNAATNRYLLEGCDPCEGSSPCGGATPALLGRSGVDLALVFHCPDSGHLEYDAGMRTRAARPRGYRCEATSVGGFIQQLAVAYISRGYWFYVTGEIPEGKVPDAIDAKLIQKYAIGKLSPWSRSRRKKEGEGFVQYLRYGSVFVLLASHGARRFFEEEGKLIRDVRSQPLYAFGYSIQHVTGHTLVRIEECELKRLRRHFSDMALSASVGELCDAFEGLGYEPYIPVFRQYRKLHRMVNRMRRIAGLERVPLTCLRSVRHLYRPFERAERAAA
jgi:hypothetical protein